MIVFPLHQIIEPGLPLMQFLMLCISVRRGRDFGDKLYHMLNVLRYRIKVVVLAYLAIDHDHKTMRHVSQ